MNVPLFVSSTNSIPPPLTQTFGGHESNFPMAATVLVVPRSPPAG
jgi:hypothetical protein